MKVLVAYYTQTGNTEKIAKAIGQEASLAHQVEIKKIGELDAAHLPTYDFIFIGSPIHGGNLSGPAKEFLNNMPAGAGRKMAGFITHFAPAYPQQALDGFTEPIKAACRDKGIEYQGCFDCQGALTESLHEMVRKRQNLSEEQWKKMVEQMTGRPNNEDAAKAKAFARQVLA
jgi:flavodoxin I